MDEIGILQIIPAENWWAIYKTKRGVVAHRLVCWALVNEKGARVVKGMHINELREVGLCPDDMPSIKEYFWGYVWATSRKEAENQVEESILRK